MRGFRPYHWGGRVIKLIGRLGVDIRPLLTRDRRVAGAMIRWHDEEHGLMRGAIVDAEVETFQLRLFVENDFDVIQQVHRTGALYELEELEMITSAWRGGTFVDVGANVGNHTLFAAVVLDANRVIAIEPQEAAVRVLETNAALNHISDRVEVHCVGLSDEAGRAALQVQSNNLGATRLITGDVGVEVVRGDALIDQRPVDFIKIDTEGFELTVLGGLSATIERERPPLLVEVETKNLAAFEQFCAAHGYSITRRFQRYSTSVNCLATPRGEN